MASEYINDLDVIKLHAENNVYTLVWVGLKLWSILKFKSITHPCNIPMSSHWNFWGNSHFQFPSWILYYYSTLGRLPFLNTRSHKNYKTFNQFHTLVLSEELMQIISWFATVVSRNKRGYVCSDVNFSHFCWHEVMCSTLKNSLKFFLKYC